MKKPKSRASGGSWMDTYGDMVTLLLCFFVLLYAISSLDQSKFQNFVASVNPEMAEELQEMRSAEAAETQAEEDALQQMYESLTSEFESMGLDANVDVVRGDGYNFISFSDEIFFNGDSYVLTDNGREVLDGFARALAPAAGQIHEIQVLGHTTELPERFNTVEDRMLSAERAAQVTAYIQSRDIIDPARMLSIGYGQFRVEILITSDDAVMRSLTEYYSEVYGADVAAMQPDAGDTAEAPAEAPADTAATPAQ